MIHHHIRKHILSFSHALRGMYWAFRTERSYAIHFFLSFLSLAGGLYFHVSYFEFLIIIMVIFGGLAMEMVNTAIEETTNAIDTKWREDIKRAKDVSAGAMLMYAIGAFVIACYIFIPHLVAEVNRIVIHFP